MSILIKHQPIDFYTTPTQVIHFIQFHTKTYGHLWPILHKPGTVFTVPKKSKWAVHGQPTLPTSVPLGGTDFHSHFWSPTHQNRIYSINSNTTAHYSFWRFTTVPKVSKISTISVPCFGTDQAAHSRPFSYQYMYFNTKFPHKQPKNSGQSRMVGKIPNNF